MSQTNLFAVFTDRMSVAGVEYMVTGSVASIVYGEPRVTHDIDLVIWASKHEAEKIAAAFPDEEFYCPPLEVLRTETNRRQRGHFNLIHFASGFKADVYLAGRDSLHAWGYGRRREVDLDGTTLWLAPPEYVIVRKLQFYQEGESEKHLRDIRLMLDASSDAIDDEDLNELIGKYGLDASWKLAKQYRP